METINYGFNLNAFYYKNSQSVKRQILTQLENRLALVINGATGEKYLIKTLDYNRNKFYDSL